MKTRKIIQLAAFLMLLVSSFTHAADKELLDILLGNGSITKEQYEELLKRPSLTSKDISVTEQLVEEKVDEALEKKAAKKGAVEVSHDKTGFKVESTDGTWSTKLNWRAQMRFTSPYRSDPRQVDDFDADSENTFELRRVRMKIGGHAYEPWLDYYFEVDLQPTRSESRDAARASSRLIDWRITAQPYEELGFRIGQWKIDYNRERVDSSGRQQFVERSIVNRQFTIDRQMGAQVRGRFFKDTPADLRYYVGAFTGQGRGVQNDDDKLMYAGRLQWNFLGRDLKLRQTDVEFTEKPTGSISFGAATNTGGSTRWSSSGGGNLDGFTSPSSAEAGQFEVEQYQAGSAFKYRGFSWQQEYHWKKIRDRVNNETVDMKGAYAQAGYFFHYLIPAVPKQLELAARYAFVDEPNQDNIQVENKREEFTIGANWFIAGHNNKITVDYSKLYLDDSVLNRDVDDGRFRVQWDISF
ncbi:MAG: phosphate-selective porin [Lentimonas sp.]|jgi:phosphate-selective porin